MLRSVRKAAGVAQQGVRTFAAVAEKPTMVNFTFATPFKIIHKDSPVHMVVADTNEGQMGYQARHKPTLAELKPGVVSVFDTKGANPTRYFVPGGYMIFEADSSASITASEAIPLEDLDVEAAKKALNEAQAKVAAADKSSKDPAVVEAKINAIVYKAVVQACEKYVKH